MVSEISVGDCNHMIENLAPDSPHLLYHTPQWLPGHLCSTWEPDCGSAPDQLCPRFQTWLLCRPNILSESERQLQGHKAEGPVMTGPVATELRKMCCCESNNFRPMLETHRGGLSGWLSPHLENWAPVMSNTFYTEHPKSGWLQRR